MRKLIVICLLSAWFAGDAQQNDSTVTGNNKKKISSIVFSLDTILSTSSSIPSPQELKALMDNEAFLQDGMVHVPYEPKSDDFLDSYMEIVYRKSSFADSLNKNRMRLWKGPVKVFIDSSVPAQYGRVLEEFANNLDNLVDSLRIRFVESPDLANYLVYHVNKEFSKEYEPKLQNTDEGYYVYWKQSYKISQGFLKINTERIANPEIIQSLMKWRFFNSLGYFSTRKDLPCEDYLSSCFQIGKQLSANEFEMRKYHY